MLKGDGTMQTGMKKWGSFAALLMAAILLVGSGMARSDVKTETLTGTMCDVMCGAKHRMMTFVSDKDCTLGCVKLGFKYALFVGGKVYELDGKESDLEKFAGEKVKITGTVDGKKLHVTAVDPA
jgi:hypothetical protein